MTGVYSKQKSYTLAFFFLIAIILIPSIGLAAKKKATKCESPWRTFRKTVCFFFSDMNNQKFTDAQEMCFNKGGFLASIRNSAENGFILKTIQGMGSSYQRVRFFIGLYQYDEKDNTKYRWLDGSVSPFRNWMSTQPNSIYERCAQLDGSNGFKWRDDLCDHRSLFICRKDLDEEGSMSCFKGRPPPKQVFERKGISVTECLEHCRGSGFPLAGLVPDKCYCMNADTIKSMEKAKRQQCGGHCQGQHCGNKDFVTIYNLTFYKDTAESCDDLSQLGFSSPSTYVTKVGDEERLQNCFSNGNQFKFNEIKNLSNPVATERWISKKNRLAYFKCATKFVAGIWHHDSRGSITYKHLTQGFLSAMKEHIMIRYIASVSAI